MEGLSRSRRSALVLIGLIVAALSACAARPEVTFARDDAAGALTVFVGGREAFVLRYGPELDLVHYWPLRAPSGRNLLVQKTEPYPHHRSFWFADTVRIAGGERDLSFYNALTSGVRTEAGDYVPPFRDRVRLVSFPRIFVTKARAEIVAELVWESDGRPVLDERRALVVHSLGGGEYLLDLTWTLTPSAGDVLFTSDDVHYAWPYLRLDPVWSGDRGGKIVSDTGATGEQATTMKPALWIDYSNTVEGVAEGVAVFQWPGRPDDRSGKPFTLEPGESLTQRVGVLVHQGDVAGGRVRTRYEKYVRGDWK